MFTLKFRTSAYLIIPITLSIIALVGFFLCDQSESHDEKGGSDALLALDLWTTSRAYPETDIPIAGYASAHAESKKMRRVSEAFAIAPSPWVSIGPTNFAGRTISILLNPINPNTIYVGAASGGLWRSHTGGLGADWHRIVTGFPVLGVNAIAMHSADTNTMYIGTGEVYRYNGSTGGIVIRATRGSYGMGILKTTDGGATWTKSLDWTYNQQRGVQCIRINPLNPFTVLAATSEGVFKSTNGGVTWGSVLNALLAQDIAINPRDTTKVLVTCGNFASAGSGVYRSTDGGETFSLVSGLPHFTAKGMLEIYGANPWSVYASLADTSIGSSSIGTGSLWKSTDFGASWSLVSNQSVYGVQGWYSQFVAVHPSDSNRVVRGGQDIWRSTNGGVTSTQIPFGVVCWADYHNYAHHPFNPNILYIVDDGGVWRSTDFGNTYEGLNEGLLTSQFYNGFSCSAQDSNRALGQVQDHFGWMYTGSPTWPESGVDEIGWTAIHPSNDNIMYAGTRGGGAIYKSVNRGQSFSSSSAGISGGVSAWNTPFVLSTSNPNYLYFGRSIVFRTTNGGTNWSATNGGVALDGNPSLSMAVAPTNQDTVFVGTVPGTGRIRIFRTTNGGSVWTNVTGDLPNRYPLDIAIDPRNSKIVYIAFGGFDTTRLAKSTDAGVTWTHFNTPLPNVPTTAVAVDPFNPDHVYVGNDLGVFVTTDAGVNWASFNEGLAEAVIAGDLVISSSNKSIRLATHSNGVYTRKLLSSFPTGVNEPVHDIPEQYALHQNFPNPFNPTTQIAYWLSKREHVMLKVYDIGGRDLSTLVDRKEEAGRHLVEFDASHFSSGVYLYVLRISGRLVEARKMILIR